MPDRDGYPPGVPCWVDTTQPDPDAAAAFYRDLFGWEVEDVMPPGQDAKYFMGRIRGRDVAAVTHITHILQKLELRDRVQAVVLAYQTGVFADNATR